MTSKSERSRMLFPGATAESARRRTAPTTVRTTASATVLEVVLAGVLASSALATPAAAQQVGRVPLEVRMPAVIRAATALGRAHLGYELHVTNLGTRPLRLGALDVLAPGGQALESLTGARLAQRATVVGAAVPGAAASRQAASIELAVGARAVVFMWVTLAPDAPVPASVRHRFVVGEADTLLLPAVPVDASVPMLEPPVRGGPWVAIRGPSATSGHRLSLVTLGGVARVAQRFAVDWARLGEDGKLFRDDSTRNDAWYGYGDTVYAVAAGRVVTVRDGAPDAAPFAGAPDTPIEPHQATGNVVVLDLGGGRFATYAHLRAGSIRVKEGDRLAAGQSVARIGNSGNTHGPHLHFHVSDGSQPLASDGLPFTMRAFALVGRVPSLAAMLGGAAWAPSPSQPPRVVAGEMPLENMIVRFTPR